MTRWLRWNLICLRGRRCADIVMDDYDQPDDPEMFRGMIVRMEYVCGNCDTRYRRSALLAGDGAFTQDERERIR